MQVLIADDDAQTRYLLDLYCRSQDFTAVFADSGRAALERFMQGDIDAIVTDVLMPDISGEQVLDYVKKNGADTPVLIMTAQPTIDDAVRFLKRGADDYVTKPVTQEVFLHRVRALLERVKLTREIAELKRALPGETTLIGNTPALAGLLRKMPMTAQTDATVLITGESGTGKELVARRIHELSRRKAKRFVPVNCGALTDTLLESELFGYKRGAFTDAHKDTAGLVEEADGGTLFLDEIGEVSPAVQVKLLRFLQLKEYKPLGSPKAERADVRIVAATNRDLSKMVKDGAFREDLYYRLNIVPLSVPPLRDRRADVPLLAQHFLKHWASTYGKDVRGFSPEGLAELMAYDWPGNVRELENRVQRLVVLATESLLRTTELDVVALPAPQATAPLLLPYKAEKGRALQAFDLAYAKRMLDAARGNISEAARLAHMDRKNFWTLAKRSGALAISKAASHDG